MYLLYKLTSWWNRDIASKYPSEITLLIILDSYNDFKSQNTDIGMNWHSSVLNRRRTFQYSGYFSNGQRHRLTPIIC